MDLATRTLRSSTGISGPLLFVERAGRAALGELVLLRSPGQDERRGQVIALSDDTAVVQVFEDTRGLAPADTAVVLGGDLVTLPVARGMLGRTFDGSGRPIDGLPPPIPEAIRPIEGAPINALRREPPSEPIETGVSAIDGMNTLVRGQKLPIFTCAGLPAPRLAAQIVTRARVRGGEPFAVVFAAIGATRRDSEELLSAFSASDARGRTVVFLNHADAPPIERLMTPRCALTAAEHLAYEHGMHVLVVLVDVTAYCEALREVALAREEIPGRRGYPGYMYTDLATLFERAGRIAGRPGSVTQLPVVTMPDDDVTHPIPDLTGYITEGQLVLSRELERRGVFPPVDVLPSLSRLMGRGIGRGRTREDHRGLADQLYALYAAGRDARRMAAIVGAANLGPSEKRALRFADRFETELIHQGRESRSFEETLEVGWRLLADFPREALTRVSPADLARHRPEGRVHGADGDDADGVAGDAGTAGDRPGRRTAAAEQA